MTVIPFKDPEKEYEERCHADALNVIANVRKALEERKHGAVVGPHVVYVTRDGNSHDMYSMTNNMQGLIGALEMAKFARLLQAAPVVTDLPKIDE